MTKFSDLKLDPKVLKAIDAAGYETPTPIQAGAIPPALEGKDVLGIAQTGTGKTASFTLPMITLLGRGRARARMPRSLVLCPTRELAAQVAENFDIYAKNTKLTKALLIGGVSFGEQDKLIDRGVDVLIATPGRLLDHFERGKLLLTGVQIMVVDEADRMLDMGFIPDIERIFQLTPFTRQTLFFSATMAPEIERITNTFLHAPERIEVARQATTSETITQKLIQISPPRRDQNAKQKRDLLRAIIDDEGEGLKNAIIFCNRKTDVDIVAKSLKKHGYDAAPIHGDLDQSQRMRTLDGFRDGSLRFLVASDVAARGLDIPAVSHVFNYDLPSHAEDYVHRIGRTGRAGRQGTAISLSTPADDKYLDAIEALVKQTLPRAEPPAGFSPSARPGRSRDTDRDEPRRTRGGRGGRGGRRSERDERNTAPLPEAIDISDQPDSAASTPVDTIENAAPQHSREDRGGNRRGGGRDRGRGGRRDDHNVVGLGDHVPAFMLNSFRPEDLQVTPSEPAEDAPQEAAADTPPKPKRTRRKAAETVSEDGAATPPAEKPTRTRRKKAEPAPDATAEAADAAPAEKPKRTRRKKADAPAAAATSEATTEAGDATSPAEKPKRTRRSKKAAAPEPATAEASSAPADATAKAETAAAPAEKPKRSRRKKSEDSPIDAG